MRVGSLFAGIGGLDWAAEQAFGARTAWQLDLTGEQVRTRHFPGAQQIVADVAKVDPLSLPPIDVLCGGFACQDLSAAGKQASRQDIHAGERTGATYRGFLRFVQAIRPRFIVAENVYGLLAHRATLERDLDGYGLTWVVCEAMDIGAPHHRRRVFAIGERGARGQGLIEPAPLRRWTGSAWPTITARAAPDCPGERNRTSPSLESMVQVLRPWATATAANPNEGEDPELWHRRRAELAAKGVNGNGAGEPLGQQVRAWSTICASEADRGSDPSGARLGSPGLIEEVRPWPTVLAADADDVKRNGRSGNPSLNYEARQCPHGRRMNPEWVEILMGFPIGWTLPVGERLEVERAPRFPRGRYPESWDRSVPWPGEEWEPPRTLPDGPPCPGRPARLRALGNAVSPQQGLHAIKAALVPQQVGLFDAA